MDIVTRMDNLPGDGSVMPAFVAEPKAVGNYPVVVVFMEAFGLNGHIKKVAERFARDGYVAITPDMFYRQGKGLVFGYDEIAKVMPVMQNMVDAQTIGDIRIAIDYAKGLKNALPGSIGCAGYCMGGTMSWLAACLNRDIKAAAVYYSGGLITQQMNNKRPVSPHLYAEHMTAAVLGCFGEEDRNPPAADVLEVEAALTKLGKVHDFKIYPQAGHGFSCDERPSYHRASSEDAWARTFAWFKKYLAC